MNKPIYLGISILDISKTLMYEFWYYYIKPTYQWNWIQWSCAQDRAKLCYTDIDSFVTHFKTEDFYEDIDANDVEKRFDTSNYSKDYKRPLPINMNKKIIGLFKDELGGRILTEFVALKAKIYAYLMDDDSEHKKAKRTKKCIIKRKLMFKNYKNCQSNNMILSY